MADTGLYIHVPFCKRKCGYCDFYSGTDCRSLAAYPEAVCRELRFRTTAPRATDTTAADTAEDSAGLHPGGRRLSTVYFGGGTPSLLPPEAFRTIFRSIAECFSKAGQVSDAPLVTADEITLEANPDDLTDAYLAQLQTLPFNRISIGIQSFDDDELSFIGRRHTARQAREAVGSCRRFGFGNISIDLMYGLPFQTMASWARSVDEAIALGVEHISAYMLSLEPDVPLSRSLQAGAWRETDDDTAEAMYRLLCDQLRQAGYEHYEISNFARPGRRSRHNSSYWHGVSYLGLGPGADSYDAASHTRSWNAPDLPGYLRAYGPEGICEAYLNRCGQEHLTADDLYNEYVMTRLRTSDGVDPDEIGRLLGEPYALHFRREAAKLTDRLHFDDDACGRRVCRLTADSLFVSDGIIRELMI